MILQANIFLLLFGAIQGLLLSIAILGKRERHPSHVFLTLFLVIVGLQLTFKIIAKVWLMDNVRFFYACSYSLPLLAAPALYLFIRSRATGVKANLKDLLHAIPFIVLCSYNGVEWVRAGSELISFGIYYWYSRKLIDVSQPILSRFLNYVSLAEILVVIALATSVIYYGRIPDIRLMFVGLTVLIYWITWKVMSDPGALVALPVSLRYAHSGLKDDEAVRIESGLRRLMNDQKLFTDTTLTIDKLAASLHTSRHHLSQVLNERIHRPYTEYISELRLEEARRRLADPRSSRYTIAAIAHDSGFSTVSTFNEAFKKRYGVTPSASRKVR